MEPLRKVVGEMPRAVGQHFVPYLLLKHFACSIGKGRRPEKVLMFRRAGSPICVRAADAAKQREFHGKDISDGLESRTGELESRFASIVHEHPDGPISAEHEPKVIAFVSHLAARTRAVREHLNAVIRKLFIGLSDRILNDQGMAQKVRSQVYSDPRMMTRIGLLPEVERLRVLSIVDKRINAMMPGQLTLGATALRQIKVEDFVKDAHNLALAKVLPSLEKSQRYTSLKWSIVELPEFFTCVR
jgi:hypothetical protein